MVTNLNLAKLCKIVYEDNKTTPTSLGFETIAKIRRKNAVVYVVAGVEEIVIVYRGSDDFKDWIEDINVLVKHEKDFGDVHAGALYHFKLTKQVLWEALSGANLSKYRVVITGHSLGAVAAQMCALWLWQEHGVESTCKTFAGFPFAQGEFARRFADAKIDNTRFVCDGDPAAGSRVLNAIFHHLPVDIKLGKSWFKWLPGLRWGRHLIETYVKELVK